MDSERIDDAIKLYEQALDGMFKNDYYTISRLAEAYFNKGEYERVCEYAERVTHVLEFKKSRTQFIYGAALVKMGKSDLAEEQLKQIDSRYSNYPERIFYADFLLKRGKKDAAKEVYNEILSEAAHMKRENKRKNSESIFIAREELEKLKE